jgi:hypothetical protein
MVFVSRPVQPYVELYKNGILQTPVSFNSSGLCKGAKHFVEVFPNNTYDDFAIWSRVLPESEIVEIFEGYGKSFKQLI